MFVIGTDGDDVNEYELSTPFDASTRTWVDATSISSQETSPTGIAFSIDGARMFVIGITGDDVNEYELSTPFDASTRTWVDATSISSQESNPQGIAFSSDGTKMFVIGSNDDNVNEYDLSSVYPIAVTGTYVQPPPTFVSSGLDFTTGNLAITFSEEIDAANVVPAKIHVRETGTYTGGVTLTAGELVTIADSATIRFTLNAEHLAAVAAMTESELTIDPGAVQDTSGSLIVGTFEASTATFVDATSITSQEFSPTGIAFSSDGTKMFVIGNTGKDVNEYNLSTPFDVSTRTWVDATSISEQETYPTGIAFSSDGAKMFVIGKTGDDVNEYELSTPFDASTRTWVDATSISSQESNPTGIAFSSDGTKMFVVGIRGGDVNEYELSTPFDVSTASFVGDTPISSQESSPEGIAFSSDGTKMFVIGNSGDDVNEYKLRVPFEASTRTFVGVTSIFEENTIPTDIAFSNDGAKMFVIDNQARSVNEYDLSSAYPIVVTGTYVPPPPTFASSILDMETGNLAITFLDEIDATPAANIVPAKIHVRESGTYTGGVALTATELVTTTDGTVISFTLNAAHLKAVAAMVAPELTIAAGAVQDTSGRPIIGTFEASTRTFVGATSISEQEDTPTDIAFSSDGTKMFVIGITGGDVNEYELSAPFDVSTRTWVDATSISEQETNPRGIAFSSDGTKMFVIGITGGDVNEYELSAPFDVSTRTWVDATSISEQETAPTGIAFSSDGTKMFVIGDTGDDVNEYELSAPFDASTRTFVDATPISAQETLPTGIAFSSDGAKMFVIGDEGDDVNEYALSAPFDASTRTFVDATSIRSEDSFPTGIAFSIDGAKMFVIGDEGDDVNEYALSSVYPIEVAGTYVQPPLTFVSSILDFTTRSLVITFSEEIDVASVVPAKIHVRESGTYTGGVTLTAGEHGTVADSATISLALNAVHLEAVAAMAVPELTIDPGAVQDTSGRLIVGTFETSTATFVDATSIRSQETAPTGIAFSSDGTKMFVIGETQISVIEYDLRTPFDASTATVADITSIANEEFTPTGIAFSSDGAKMFVIGADGDDVSEYELSTPFKASTATFVDATSTRPYEFTPTGIAFSSDGTKMFVIGDAGDDVNEYTLSTPFDASTRTFVDATSISEQETYPTGIAFSSDGAKMFVIGDAGDDVNEYELSTPFDASTRTFVGNTTISEQEDSPTDIAFSSDGAKMFVIGWQKDAVIEYDLSSVYPIAVTGTYVSPPPTFVSSMLGMATGSLEITFSDEIDAANIVPASIHVRETGTYAGGVTLTAGELVTTTDGAVISFTLNATHIEAVAAMAAPELTIDPGAVRDTYGSLIVGTFDVSTASFVDATSISSQESTPTGIAFSSDGTKMFVVGWQKNAVIEYELSTPFDASTRTWVDDTSISEQEDSPTDIAFSSDGTRMFVIGDEGDDVNEYALSTPFDASTRTFVDATSIQSQETLPTGIAFSSDGTRMFVIGDAGDDVNEYALSTPFDASTRTFVDVTQISEQETFPTGIVFSSDGTRMFVIGDEGDDVNEYALSAPFDASTRTFVDATSIQSQETLPTGITFSSDGAKMFVIGDTGKDVNEYDLSSVYPIAVTGNVAPVLNTIDDQTVNELVELTFTATASDDDSLTFSLDGTVPSGAAITSAGVFTWTPTELQDGDHTITVQVTDGSLTDSETLTVTVNEVNVAPVLNAIGDKGTSELVELTFTATASDTDVVDNVVNTLTFSFDGTVPSGAAITDDGNFTWTPTESQVGSHDITVQVTDGSLTDSETLTVTVRDVNVAPVLNTIDDQTVNEFVELTFTATASDDDSLTFSLDGTVPSGAAITSAGVFTWTPTELQDGDHTITVQVTDGSLTDSETLTVTVNEVNVAPVLNAIGDKGTSELVELTFTATASDTDVVDNVVNTLTFSFDGTVPSGAAITDDGNFTWTPTESQVGSHDITVQVTDGSLTDSETLTVTVRDVNVAPVLNTIDDQTVNEFVELTFTATASDDDSLTFSFDGTFPSGAAITDDGNFTWTPTELQDGDHTITVQVTDGSLTDSETLTVTVNEVNVAPVLNAIGDKGTSELVELTFTATASDTDVVDNVVNTLTFSFDGTVPSGAAITDDGNFTWTPTESQVGSHDITVQVTDGSLTDSETLTVTVRDVNVAPVLNTIDDQTVNEFVELTFTATASDDDSLTFSFDGTFPSGAAITDDGNFTWTPTELQDGDHTITVQVTDGSLTDSETLTVTVNEVNVAPVLNAIGDKGTSELVELTFTATASDTDVVDNVVNTLTFSFDGTVPSGAAITDDGNFTWTPTESQVGSHDITVQVTDGSLTDSETLTVTVRDVNVAPVLNTIDDQTVNEFVELTFTATASDDDSLTFSFDGTFPSGAAITDDGNFTWTPTELQDGDHTITVQVTDGSLTDSETLTVTVNEVNVAPVLNAIGDKGTSELVELTFTATASDTDVVDNVVNTLTFSFDGTVPLGAAITSAGVFTWTPTESQVGPHDITVQVTDGSLTDSETLTVTVKDTTTLSDNADLGSLTISSGTLSPQFSSSDITYTASVDNSVTQVTVTPTASDSSATITVNDNTVTSGIGYIVTGLTVGDTNTVTVIVIAQDSTTKTYIITVTRAAATLSDNADLDGLTISSGTLSPQFSSSDITYTASVDNSVTQVTVTPTASDSSATITVNDNTVTSGIGYIVTGLTVGDTNTVTVIVIAQDSTTKTYIITVTRAAATLSDNADLDGLTISSGTLSPQFSSSDITYTASVDNSVTQVTVTPTASDSSATITVNDNTVTSGIGYIVTGLTVGEPNTVTVIVTAQDSTTKTYIITVTRAAATLSDNADLDGLTISSGTLSPQFSSSDITYTASVDNSVTQVTVTPTASDSSATITVNDNTVTSGIGYIVTGLTVDEPNTVTVIVTAQDSTTKTYIITVTRAAATLSDNADLDGLTISSGTLSPQFSSSDITYTASVDNSVTQVTVTPTASDSSATITVNDNTVTSGIGYIVTGLTVDEPNTVTVIVTAQDSTTKTYIITVTRAAATLSDNADLGGLTISSGTLSPQFSSSDITYTASVDNSVTQVTVTPTASDSSATITVNGNTVTSGIGYIVTGLTVDEPNTVTVIVTAQDSTTKTYIITVTRAAATLSDNADLDGLTISSGTLSPQFSSSDITYTASVDNSVTQVTVTPTASDSSATITVNGNTVTSGIGYIVTGLTVDEPNTVTVIVTAQDSTTKTYIITVTVRDVPITVSSAAYNPGNGQLTITFNQDIATVDYSGLHVRSSANLDTGGIMLSSVTGADYSGRTITATLDSEQQDQYDALQSPHLVVEDGAVTDTDGDRTTDVPPQPIRDASQKGSSSSPSFKAPIVHINTLAQARIVDIPSHITEQVASHDASDPLEPITPDGTFDLPLVINGYGYLLDAYENTLIPQTVTAGDNPVHITFTVYTEKEFAHFILYLNLQGRNTNYADSDTYITYKDDGTTSVTDPHGYIGSATVTVTQEDDQIPEKRTVRITIEFGEEPMGPTNMVVYMWNTDRKALFVKIIDALEVVAASPESAMQAADPEPLEPDSVLPADPEPVTPDFADDAADPEPVPYDILGPDDYDDTQILQIIRMWSGFESESITDAQLLELLGLDDYQGADIPNWMMTELGVLVAKGTVTVDEFLVALQYVLEHV